MYYKYIETWLLYLMNTSENLYDVNDDDNE